MSCFNYIGDQNKIKSSPEREGCDMSTKRELRIAAIYTYLLSHNYASVNELVEEFKVSKSTIKRDLEEMEKKNMTDKVRGGTVIKLGQEDPPYSTKKNMDTSAKAAIGRAAAELVEDDDVVLILGGITCFEVYKAIHAQNVTVFSVNVETFTAPNEHVAHLYALEGEVSVRSGVINGIMTLQNLQRITPDKVFLSTSLSDDFVLQCRTDREFALVSAVANMSAVKIFMADRSTGLSVRSMTSWKGRRSDIPSISAMSARTRIAWALSSSRSFSGMRDT